MRPLGPRLWAASNSRHPSSLDQAGWYPLLVGCSPLCRWRLLTWRPAEMAENSLWGWAGLGGGCKYRPLNLSWGWTACLIWFHESSTLSGQSSEEWMTTMVCWWFFQAGKSFPSAGGWVRLAACSWCSPYYTKSPFLSKWRDPARSHCYPHSTICGPRSVPLAWDKVRMRMGSCSCISAH